MDSDRGFFFLFFGMTAVIVTFQFLGFERNARRAVGSDRARVNRARLLRRGHPLETATQAARARLLRRGHPLETGTQAARARLLRRGHPLVIGTRAVFASYFSGPPFYWFPEKSFSSNGLPGL